MNKILLENILKNIIVTVILIMSFPVIKNFLESIQIDKLLLGDILVAVSILAVTACFGCFAFTYEKIESHNIWSRLIAHACTGILIFIIGFALEISAVLAGLIAGRAIPILNLSWILLYFAILLYDFWDLGRIKFQNKLGITL